jgi:hypothetical protein
MASDDKTLEPDKVLLSAYTELRELLDQVPTHPVDGVADKPPAKLKPHWIDRPSTYSILVPVGVLIIGAPPVLAIALGLAILALVAAMWIEDRARSSFEADYRPLWPDRRAADEPFVWPYIFGAGFVAMFLLNEFTGRGWWLSILISIAWISLAVALTLARCLYRGLARWFGADLND